MIPAVGIGMLSEISRRPWWEAAVAAAWLPAWMTWSKWYWAIGMPSAGGAGGKLAEWATGISGAQTEGVFAVMAVCGVAGWMYSRLGGRLGRTR